MKKLDPELRMLLERHKGTLHPLAAAALSNLPPVAEVASIIVEFRGELRDLEDVDFIADSLVVHPTVGNKLATGTIAMDRLEALARIDHVVVISAPVPIGPMLDYAASEIGALAVHHRNPGGATGRGVLVGIIDSGVEARHGAFSDVLPDGKRQSRIIALWDQFSTATEGVPDPQGLGRVYDRETITQQLNGRWTLGTTDANGHGTKVAGVAAGNGAPASCCVRGNTYVGIAPGADIIAVALGLDPDPRISGVPRALGDSRNLMRALDFIFNFDQNGSLQQPLVVNISLGSNRGAHDGSDPVEKAIDMHVLSRAHSAVVVAAGNTANKGWHTCEKVPPSNGTFDVKFKVAAGDKATRILQVWYSGAGMNAKVFAPGPTLLAPVNGSHPDGVLAPDTGSSFTLLSQPGGAPVVVMSDTAVPDNHENRIQLTIMAGERPADEWTLQLINPSTAPVSFHAWLERDQGPDDVLTPSFCQPTQEVTVGVPATARHAITVAAFEGRQNYSDCFPSGRIAEFSSRGPVRADVLNNPKPQIAAPGVQITSAAADVANLRGNCCQRCPDWCCYLYQSTDGTSFAAPQVAGTIALMLEANPTLTYDQIFKILYDTAKPAPAPADVTVWGAGKLDADAAVQQAASMAGHGGTPVLAARAGRAIADRAEPEPLASGAAILRLVMARLRALPEGEAHAALISRHFSEVRRLINANSRVATMWHRCEGPTLLRRILHGAVNEQAEPPVRGDAQRDYLSRFFDQLARFGSARLEATITTHREALVELLAHPLAAQVVTGNGVSA